ncbi:MarR family winged helix-turn-helix transcriptional regulator [Rugosimonospora africana]|uniref:MarR family transcriptional regulator n=1 Tax=Rugosimonospora africana TaxID=556532 RepID=A0A8J3R448_9ACTN|nr:MarR family transcriptional regulator [Rugosimonospora africana]GIH20990.1 MarR family transcriptional regulator [Rugosimonospora africana]
MGEKQNAADAVALGAELRVVLGRVVRRVRQGHKPGELTLSEASVLARLDRDGPATPGVLAEQERVQPQAMGVTLAGLERRDLVSRASDPADGRRVVLSVTDAGRQLLSDRASASVQRMTRALAEGFTADERRLLADVIPLLDRLADQL